MNRQELIEKHGTLEQFTLACQKAYLDMMITYDEAQEAIKKYAQELKEPDNESTKIQPL